MSMKIKLMKLYFLFSVAYGTEFGADLALDHKVYSNL
jgi:hypothetical protein